MNLESLFSQEKLKDTTPKTEFVQNLEVSNFELSNLASTEEIASYITETIPISHLENCSSIKYEPVPSELYPGAMGTFDRETHDICLWGEHFAGPEELYVTMTHEIGHNVHENIIANNPELAQKWSQLHQQSWGMYLQDGSGFAKPYSMTNEYEDFADSYMMYIQDPEKLQFYNPDKYEFMKDNVFGGQEYPARVLGGYYMKDDNTYSWDLLNEKGEPKVLFYCDYYGSCSYEPNGCTP